MKAQTLPSSIAMLSPHMREGLYHTASIYVFIITHKKNPFVLFEFFFSLNRRMRVKSNMKQEWHFICGTADEIKPVQFGDR